ncbi:MAG: SDR family oxidoreductase [Proteobacteria bacterium]|nr:SDR family oxidoreductase [Pseudomonadota bacterium]
MRALTIALCLLATPALADVTGTATVIDGDTLKRIFDQVSERFTEYMLSKIPRGRFVTVEEIAALIAWLCTRECSFSTGAVFDISGGRATY